MSNQPLTILPINPLPQTYADIVCDLDVDPFANETTSDLQNLIQDVTHVLLELPGTNPDDPGRGIGVDQYLSGDSVALQSLPGIIQAQLAQDDRITKVQATLTQTAESLFNLSLIIEVAGTIIPLTFGFQNGQFTLIPGNST